MRRKGMVFAILVTALLVLYCIVIVGRGVELIRTQEPLAVGMGIAVLVLPVLIGWLTVREWMLAGQVQDMADELALQNALPVDDLPRSASGRIDKTVARERFATFQKQTEDAPHDWRAWYNLAFAYDAAGDRAGARGALRTASRLYRTNPQARVQSN